MLMGPYQYRCLDESILLPFLKKYVFSVLHRCIPYGVPANYLTLVSIIVIWSCFLYFIGVNTPDDADIIIVFFAITIYVIFDHFDGLQAKKTGTGSPLGEILDHYSDVFNGSIILYLFFRILQIELGWIFYLVIWANLVAFTVTYLEQSIRKELYFGKIGSLEGVILILIILGSLMTSQGKYFWLKYTMFDVPLHTFLVIGLILGVIFTVAGSIRRLQHLPKTLIHYFLTGALLCLICFYYQISWYISFLVINVYSADLILKSMKFHLLDAENPKPDLIVYMLFLFLIFQQFFEYEIQIGFLVYGLAVTTKVVWEIGQIFFKLRTYWFWWNMH